MTLRLLSDATTPFGRKVLVAALERKIPLVEEFVSLSNGDHLDRYNPLRQIPTLVTTEGRGIYDSDVILGHLDGLHNGPPLIPADRRTEVSTRMALANGLMEAVLLRIMELRRPPGEQSPAFVARLEGRIERALDALEAEVAALGSPASPAPTADSIAAACALGYVDLRKDRGWRATRPGLASFEAGMAARPSLELTLPTRDAPVRSPA